MAGSEHPLGFFWEAGRFQYLDLNPYLEVQALLSSRQFPGASMLASSEL